MSHYNWCDILFFHLTKEYKILPMNNYQSGLSSKNIIKELIIYQRTLSKKNQRNLSEMYYRSLSKSIVKTYFMLCIKQLIYLAFT